MRCLDVGCGGGEVTFDIATIVGETGSVVGLDMDEVKLALARDVAKRRHLSQVEFRREDVMTWTQPEAFDLVYARALLQHVSDPVDMLSRMWAGVRPGGVLIAEDTDFERAFCEPPNAGFDFFIRNYIALLTERGGDANVGRRLFGYVRGLGVSDVDLSATLLPFSFGEEKALVLSTLEFSSAAMVAEGLATECRGGGGIREHVAACQRSGHCPCRPCADPGLGAQARLRQEYVAELCTQTANDRLCANRDPYDVQRGLRTSAGPGFPGKYAQHAGRIRFPSGPGLGTSVCGRCPPGVHMKRGSHE